MTEPSKKKYRFHEVSRSTSKPGVYAWYCQYELPERDIKDLLLDLQHATEDTKRVLIQDFLCRYLFSYFAEQPYNVTLRGKLKPRYAGTVSHVTEASTSLINRFIDNPERLFELSEILNAAMPDFASPIYIGSSKSIRVRLLNHTRLIKRYREGLLTADTSLDGLDIEEKADHSFAREAALVRRFDPNDLWVYTMPLTISDEYTFPIENILNRINYPLCGRN